MHLTFSRTRKCKILDKSYEQMICDIICDMVFIYAFLPVCMKSILFIQGLFMLVHDYYTQGMHALGHEQCIRTGAESAPKFTARGLMHPHINHPNPPRKPQLQFKLKGSVLRYILIGNTLSSYKFNLLVTLMDVCRYSMGLWTSATNIYVRTCMFVTLVF